jgi:hypothetical protein
MRSVVDLGVQKTGSKARQQFFTDHMHRVSDVRPFYPITGRHGSWHRPLYDSLARGDRSVLDALTREVTEQGDLADVLILSYEEMYKLDQRQIVWLKDALPSLTVLLFLRRQDQLVNSLHNQFHKSHRVSLRELESFETGMLAYDAAYDHRATIERWSGVLGRESVVPILFTKSESSIVAFFHHAGVAVDLAGYEETFPNRAMDPVGLAILRWIKRLIVDEGELPAIMTQAHLALASHLVTSPDATNYTLTMEDRQRVMSHYEASNEWVRKEFFPQRRCLFDPLEPGRLMQPDFATGRDVAEAIISDARLAGR